MVLTELQYLRRSSCWTQHSSSTETLQRNYNESLNLPSFFQLYWWPQGADKIDRCRKIGSYKLLLQMPCWHFTVNKWILVVVWALGL
ncbi:hypothetical protein GDO81_027621 [Engystomops pustulosus]|uniref:Uncharacterized protein n=1 Tax=Engystomops pustulosus TaxID=76066 RepID=A0AAV6YPA5_ENGPU|nr:hypothetical protein GDO81_027621 [Engystomops pustulosus]